MICVILYGRNDRFEKRILSKERKPRRTNCIREEKNANAKFKNRNPIRPDF